MNNVRAVAVVVPARNEERHLPACLAALSAAAGRLRISRPDLEVILTVVLDRCVDDSAAVLARWPEVTRLDSQAGQVGMARDLGMRTSIRRLTERGAVPAERIWLASTDADSVVPPSWLVEQVEIADGGTDLVLGTVTPNCGDPADDEPADPAIGYWFDQHSLSDGHPFVHGANLGIRAADYLRAGGFPPVGEHEDVRLADAARAGGATVFSTARIAVLTSARRYGRTPGGFAGYLRRLDRQLDRDIASPATA